GADNGCVRALRIDRTVTPAIGEYNGQLGAVTLKLAAKRVSDTDGLYSDEPETLTPCEAVAIPYYTWGNRGENEMSVWMNTVG
ncbi:MAG: glycoside hydrolase family 127 protein, partial [Ruminococcus sp.]|nr:glycoside hydrolase family 127 protein [Ruminococcus sp.]